MGTVASTMSCLGRDKHNDVSMRDSHRGEKVYTDEDPGLETAASDFVRSLQDANTGEDIARLRVRLDGSVDAYGWTETIAEVILEKLIWALENGAVFGEVVKDAMGRACEAAECFARDHPYYTALIAVGILAVLTPWVLTALGFGEIGIVQGSAAALWQARFAGFVPKGSLFSFLQRCGMTLRWKLV